MRGRPRVGLRRARLDGDAASRCAVIDVGDAPGWAATGPDGRHCFVPNTREDTLSVISYAERREVARLPVGDGPKQIERGAISETVAVPRASSLPTFPSREGRLGLAELRVGGVPARPCSRIAHLLRLGPLPAGARSCAGRLARA